MKYKALFNVLKIPLLFVALMWSVKGIEVCIGAEFFSHGILPRTFSGLQGVLFSPFIHKDFFHLINNTYPLIILGGMLFYFYKKLGLQIFLWLFFIAGIWLWAIGRPNFHIGASGVVYALASFIFSSGLIKKQTKLSAVSLLVIFLYGSMIWGILPIYKGVSWEGHLAGLLAGLLLAVFYKNEGPRPKKYQWEIDEELEKERSENNERNINYFYKED
jgi:membrane associated rhomboid family serine protease